MKHVLVSALSNQSTDVRSGRTRGPTSQNRWRNRATALMRIMANSNLKGNVAYFVSVASCRRNKGTVFPRQDATDTSICLSMGDYQIFQESAKTPLQILGSMTIGNAPVLFFRGVVFQIPQRPLELNGRRFTDWDQDVAGHISVLDDSTHIARAISRRIGLIRLPFRLFLSLRFFPFLLPVCSFFHFSLFCGILFREFGCPSFFECRRIPALADGFVHRHANNFCLPFSPSIQFFAHGIETHDESHFLENVADGVAFFREDQMCFFLNLVQCADAAFK